MNWSGCCANAVVVEVVVGIAVAVAVGVGVAVVVAVGVGVGVVVEMTRQPSLDLHASIYHAGDPDTSAEAAQRHSLGPRAKNARAVLKLVRSYPNQTATEYARVSDLTLTEIRRRLTDLQHANYIEKGDRRGREYTWRALPYDKWTGERV